MTENRKTLEILKARWPEVTLIIGLDVLAHFINMSRPILRQTGHLIQILITLVYISFTIIIFMLIFGFQRTVYTEGQKGQSPLVLLREGKHFVLRLVGLGLIYGLVLACLQILAFWTITHTNTGFLDTRWGTSLVYLTLSTPFNLILMKPVLLIFPLIIVLDCSILQSFKMLGRYRLRDARGLVILFLISLGLPFLWPLLPSQHGMTISHYLLTAAHIIVGQFIDLMIAVMAIRFVAAQNLIYDNSLRPLDSQDLLNPSI